MTQNPQRGLLPARPLIRWLPDETIYSLASRYHRLSGNAQPHRTAEHLFGHARGGYPHDLPSGLSYLANAFEGELGSVEAIARDHSVLPFFLIFKSQHQRQEAMDALAGARIGTLKARLGLLASRVGAICPLKACEECIAEDTREHGTAYWRRKHQFPGAWMCLRHRCQLLVSVGKRAGQDRFGWSLPRPSDLQSPPENGSISSKAEKLTRLICDAACDNSLFDSQQVSSALLRRLQELDLAKASGKLRANRLPVALHEVVHLVGELPDANCLASTQGALYGQALHSLRAPTSGHSLRHLLVLSVLFESWGDFLGCYGNVGASTPSAVLPGQSEEIEEPIERRQLIRLVESDGLSITAAATQVGVAVVTAQAWVAANGRTVPRRPSKLSPRTLGNLVDDLAGGLEIEDAAARAGVSATSATRVLRTEPGLLERRRSTLYEQGRSRARSAWLAAINAGTGIALARELEPGAYAWLYRNDRAWLLGTNASHPAQRRPESKLDWHARDQHLSLCVQSASLTLARLADGRRITLASLLRLVPDLKPKLAALDQLPLTTMALRASVGRKGRSPGDLLSTEEDELSARP
jgi:transposase